MAKQKKVKEKTQVVKKPLENPKPTCPPHYYWNGTHCVPDIGE